MDVVSSTRHEVGMNRKKTKISKFPSHCEDEDENEDEDEDEDEEK